jgi:uncharacterized protein
VSFTERAIVFPCVDETLVGVLALPTTASETGIVVVVGGPQYRAGSHRQFVLLARRLAQEGYPVLRFDCRGMGDSTGAPRSFESMSSDIAAAIDALQRHTQGVHRVALWGLCDGASAALLYVDKTRDERVCGMCLANPWVRSESSLARTHVKYYYVRRLIERDFWIKLFRGGVGANAFAELIRNLRVSLRQSTRTVSTELPFQQRMLSGWNGFQHAILLLLSSEDYTAKEFTEYIAGEASWTEALSKPRLQKRELAGADHTFSRPADRRKAEDFTLGWLATFPATDDRIASPEPNLRRL